MRRLTFPFLAIGALLLFAACSSGGSTTASPSAPASGGGGGGAVCATAPAGSTPAVTVDIKDFKFSPDPVKAKVGDVIAWTNGDSTSHTASLSDGTCGTDTLAQGATGALVFNAPGTYTYQCNIHPTQMKGYTIEVQ
jgi:plastocyanin